MRRNEIKKTQTYLVRFNQILCNMASKMLSCKNSRNITINFIECMIPHHQAAIYMCRNLLEYTNYQPLVEIAKNIIQTQTNGIEQIKDIAKTTQGYTSSAEEINSYIKKYILITNKMLNRMKNSPKCVNINLNFVNEMIPHHEGAIEMCNNLLKYKIDPRLEKLAEDIIKEQSDGVKQLKEIRRYLCN